MFNLKHFAVAMAVGFVVCAMVVTWMTAKSIDQEAIFMALQDKAEMESISNDLRKQVTEYKQQKNDLQNELNNTYVAIEQGKKERAELQERLEETKFHTRLIRTNEKLVEKYKETFPEFANAKDLGVLAMTDLDSGIEVDYFIQPLWFIDTFIIQHQELKAKELQLASYKEDEKKYGKARALTTKIIMLEGRLSTARETAFNSCEGKYNQISQDYIQNLKEPPAIEFQAPKLWSHSLAALAGFGACMGVGMSF